MKIKIWILLVPIFGIFYLIKIGNTIGWRTPLPFGYLTGYAIAFYQAICFCSPFIHLLSYGK